MSRHAFLCVVDEQERLSPVKKSRTEAHTLVVGEIHATDARLGPEMAYLLLMHEHVVCELGKGGGGIDRTTQLGIDDEQAYINVVVQFLL